MNNKTEIVKPVLIADKKIQYMAEFYDRKLVGKFKNMAVAHLAVVSQVKKLNITELRQTLNDCLESIERNAALRDTELQGFDEA